jgi:hypothetical protein
MSIIGQEDSLMKSLITFLLLISFHAFADNGRSPAVEDFVGVEPEGYVPAQKGTEVLFDFGKNIGPQNVQVQESNPNNTVFAVLAVFLLLPFGIWFGINKQMKDHEESVAEVHHLDDYREQKSHDDDDDIKKAS